MIKINWNITDQELKQEMVSRLHKAKKWDTGTVYRILSNPVYAGYTKHYDVNYEGEHEAIIPRDQWEKVQQMMIPEDWNEQRRLYGFPER